MAHYGLYAECVEKKSQGTAELRTS